MTGTGPTTVGVVSAGGQSSRFGSPKALATVGGVRVVDRVIRALEAVLPRDRVVCIANDPALAAAIGLPARRDLLRDVGALAGVHAALQWAQELDAAGALVVGCDMPFVEASLLQALLDAAGDADVIIPCSEGRRGVEPLCAWYGVRCITAIEAAVHRGDARMIGFHEDVSVVHLPLADVRRHGDPARMFLNINTPADLKAAEALAAGT
ncbi:MAG TPA: molybdenum cofactor guanylyltransferase [Longimicrobiales bacterium]|nr:molybdenum cofactor guanylyltransferase [Longimicrobiales bacterium]